MNKDFRRRNWSQDRFPMNIIRAIGGFFRQIQYWLSWPFRALLADRGKLKEHRPGIIRRVTFPFLWLLAGILYAIANAGELIVGWSRSRQSRALLYGMPAFVAFSLFAFVVIYLMNIKSGSLVNNYLLKATKAENIERFDTARIYYKKLLQLDKSNQSYEFLIARSYDSEGNTGEAIRRMATLKNKPAVSGVVNFWFAKKTLEDEVLKDEEKWLQCLFHLDEFLSEAPQHYEANLISMEINTKLAELQASKNNLPVAIQYMEKAETFGELLGDLAPNLLLTTARIQKRLAELLLQTGKKNDAQDYRKQSSRTISKAIDFYQAESKKDPRKIEYLLRLSDCYLFNMQFDAAISVIDTAMRNDIAKAITPQLTAFKSKILSEWARGLLVGGEKNPRKCIELVDQAIFLDPKNQQALAILAQISALQNDEVSLAAKQKLEAAIGDASAPFSVHVVLGSYAASQKNDELAVKHLRQALLLNRRATAVMNNLAFVLARLKEPRYEEALALINNALKIIPNNPRFLDTRGNIYLQMKQYEFAFHDFEAAEINMKNNLSLYENLLFLTNELGFEDLYRNKYEKRIAELKAGKIVPK